jgi:hypothetical protein
MKIVEPVPIRDLIGTVRSSVLFFILALPRPALHCYNKNK